ncbi:DUF1311 domain-containing protein [Variovorax paradoxus]|uniref:DUF1311 domain-containing protein n=2 Tax=Variovorax paradoxus TaxID=34073 RepID=A0A5Q0M3A5_VARPD|nr:DUF1311 domain-containing protein [Variovorax paradoxus]
MKNSQARCLVCVVAVALSTVTSAASSRGLMNEGEIRLECGNEFFSMAAVRTCLDKKQAQSEVVLKRAEAQARKAIARWDEDDKYIDLAKTRLAVSSRAFAKYRTEHCAFAASMGGGAIGNALEMGRAACGAELNQRRAEQLRLLVSELPPKQTTK